MDLCTGSEAQINILIIILMLKNWIWKVGRFSCRSAVTFLGLVECPGGTCVQLFMDEVKIFKEFQVCQRVLPKKGRPGDH